MKGKGRSRQAILAAVTVLAAAQAGTAYASTGPASESGVQTGAWIQEGQDWKYQGTDGTLKPMAWKDRCAAAGGRTMQENGISSALHPMERKV